MIKRGEIYWVDLNPVVGKETAKTRPALIISNDYNNEFAGTVTVLPITSKTDKVYPFEVLIKSANTGLSSDSKIKANQIRTVDKSRLRKLIGKLSHEQMEAVGKAIMIHLDLE